MYFLLTYRHRANGNRGQVMIEQGLTKQRILGLPSGHQAGKYKEITLLVSRDM